MRTIEVYTTQAVESHIKDNAKSSEWYILKFNGFVFKINGKWAQVMQSPSGLRDSGVMGHKSAKSICSEVLKFIESTV